MLAWLIGCNGSIRFSRMPLLVLVKSLNRNDVLEHELGPAPSRQACRVRKIDML